MKFARRVNKNPHFPQKYVALRFYYTYLLIYLDAWKLQCKESRNLSQNPTLVKTNQNHKKHTPFYSRVPHKTTSTHTYTHTHIARMHTTYNFLKHLKQFQVLTPIQLEPGCLWPTHRGVDDFIHGWLPVSGCPHLDQLDQRLDGDALGTKRGEGKGGGRERRWGWR